MSRHLEHICRFRSTKYLLDEYKELENQEIYFASPSELNDPLEGFKDLFWRANAVIWRNFLRHYLLCLMRAVLIAAISEHDDARLDVASFMAATEEDLPSELQAIFTRISDEFLSDAEIAPLPKLLEGRVSPIRRSELLSVLWMLHFRAIQSILRAIGSPCSSTGIDQFFLNYQGGSLRFSESFAEFNLAAKKHAGAEVAIEKIAESFISVIEQSNLILAYNGSSQKHGIPWQRVLSSFPDNYVNALEKLLFYDTYTASFVNEPSQASMWSVYGDQHRGCCLRFRVRPTAEGSPALNLYHFKGESSSPSGTRLNFEYGLLPLQK